MKDWEKLIADVDMILGTHFTSGRSANIDAIVLHHNAGNLTVEDCYRVWNNREASAHYQVEENGRIGQLVNDWDTAWHAGPANDHTIGIEHANNAFGPWTISEATLDNGAHLVAALCKHYGLGEPEWMVNVFPHSHFMATACPGEIAGSQNAEYMARAKKYYAEMTGGSYTPSAAPAPNPAPAGKTVAQLADEVLAGKHGNGDARKASLGAMYDEVQAEVNRRLGASPEPEPTPSKSVAQLADEVLAGMHGNGDARRASLGNMYDEVQAEVNRRLGVVTTPAADIDALAHAVIRGDYGNGDERRNRLGSLYDQVQARVNELLS